MTKHQTLHFFSGLIFLDIFSRFPVVFGFTFFVRDPKEKKLTFKVSNLKKWLIQLCILETHLDLKDVVPRRIFFEKFFDHCIFKTS